MLFGSIINVICIIIGTLIGLLLTKIGDKYKETIMQGIALTVTLIGLQMALETNAVIIVLVSIVFGALLGELRSEEHTSELQSRGHLVCRLLLEKKNNEHIKRSSC